MNETTLFVTVAMSFLLFLLQRTEKKARRLVFLLVTGVFLAMRQVAIDNGDEGMAWRGLLVAAVLNFVFWFLIGRYNAPKSSDEIKVIGLND